MSVHSLLYILTRWGNEIKCMACQACSCFSQQVQFIQYYRSRFRLFLSNEIETTSKSLLWCEKVNISNNKRNVVMDIIT